MYTVKLAHVVISIKQSPGTDLEGVHLVHALPKIGKNMIFWRKIMIFHTKYPKNFRTSARRNFFKCTPP